MLLTRADDTISLANGIEVCVYSKVPLVEMEPGLINVVKLIRIVQSLGIKCLFYIFIIIIF